MHGALKHKPSDIPSVTGTGRYRWQFRKAHPETAAAIAQAVSVHPSLAPLLAARGLDEHTVRDFLDPRLASVPDPFLLLDMKLAVQRILKAKRDHERVVVFGDYDVDGLSATALLTRVFRQLGMTVEPFIPSRVLGDGYGLSPDAVDRCVKDHNPTLLITVDCGSCAVEAVQRLHELGVDVVITDHHAIERELADALAVVNPERQSGCMRIAGVGVAYKLCCALVKVGRREGWLEENEVDMRRHLDLVAMGTVCDMMPLYGENRILVYRGLKELNRGKKQGLKALMRVSRVSLPVSAQDIGFRMGPRINAAGRVGDANDALKLLLTDSYSEARILARTLDKANVTRQKMERRMADEAVEEVERWFNPQKHHALVVAREGWHTGVLGIVASRLASRYGRPCIVLAFDESGAGQGSCRSIRGFDLVKELSNCSELLLRWGGHGMAAGVGLHRDNVDAFRRAFNLRAKEVLAGATNSCTLIIDGVLCTGDVAGKLWEAQSCLAPFGTDNPRPVWCLRRVRVERVQIMKDRHLRLTVKDAQGTQAAMGYEMANFAKPEIGEVIDLACTLVRRTVRGKQHFALQLEDWRQAAPCRC